MVYSTVDGQLSCFQIFIIMKSAALNILKSLGMLMYESFSRNGIFLEEYQILTTVFILFIFSMILLIYF